MLVGWPSIFTTLLFRSTPIMVNCLGYIYLHSQGSPHNQLGTLDVGRCYGLNAVFHYLRSIVSLAPFEGAKGNLATILLRNETKFAGIKKNKPTIKGLQSQVSQRKAAIKFVLIFKTTLYI